MTTYDPRGWLIWLLTTAVIAISARHPLYLILLLLAIRLVTAAHGRGGTFRVHLGRLAAVVLLLSTLFNFLTTHFGDTVIGRLPVNWPLLGGILTAEAAVYGFLNGLALITLLVLFMAFNQIVPVHDLLKLTPRALHHVGVVVLIALTYVPETQRHWGHIREAQAVRGAEMRGWRDWRPFILPLLIGGLERAMSLAEAMVARGYGATSSAEGQVWMRWGLVVGLAASLGGWVAALWVGWAGWLLLGMGTLWLGALLWRQGQGVHITRYRPRPWRLADSWLVLAGVGPAAVLLLHTAPLAYAPYPALSWPPFDPLVGLCMAAVALPALLPVQGVKSEK